MAKIKISEKIQRKQHLQEVINRKRTGRDKTNKIIADQQKEIENLKQSNDEYAKEKCEELERKLREQQDELDKMDIDIGETEKEEKEIDAMEVDEEPEDNSDGQTAQGVASSGANAGPAGQDSGQNQQNQSKAMKREPADDYDNGDAASEVPYEGDDDDDAEELPGLDVKAFKKAQGLDDTECQVKAKKQNANGRDAVFTQYGPKSHAKFRIEPGSSVYYDKQDQKIPDVTAIGYRIGSLKNGKTWRYGKTNFDSIIAVAWKPSNEASPLDDIDPEQAKERKRYPETAVLIQWKDIKMSDLQYVDETHKTRIRDRVKQKSMGENSELFSVRTWETRTVARRVFPIMKKGAADKALYIQAEKAEKAYREWKAGQPGGDITMTPAPPLKQNDKSQGEAPAPATESRKQKNAVQVGENSSTPATTSTPTTTATTAPTPNDTAPAGASKAGAPKQSPQEFLSVYEEMSGGPITDPAERVKICQLYIEQVSRAGQEGK